ncbi:MAG: glycosyltransferase [Nitrospirae bacterium]|nr:MAG: glycosyltransferase [Nitrospirota bacterium]
MADKNKQSLWNRQTMKILLVSELIPYPVLGGLARHCITLGNYLQREGHEVSIMGNCEFADAEHIGNLGFAGQLILGFKLNRTLSRRIEKYIGVYPYPLYKRFAKQIAKAINKIAEKFDVVHYHGHYPMVSSFINKDINFIQTRHDHGTFCLNKLFFKESTLSECIDPSADNCAVCFKPNNDSLRRHINYLGCLEWRADTVKALSTHKTIFVSERAFDIASSVLGLNRHSGISVIHNFIDTKDIISKINKSKDFKFNPAGVLLASTLNPAKGVSSFLKAYRDAGCNFPVTVAGSGSELASMKTEFKDYPITFCGWLEHEGVLTLMAQNGVFVVSSLLQETGPITALEAIFLGNKVYALKRGGILELMSYARNPNQVELYNNMSELVSGVASAINKTTESGSLDTFGRDFGACIKEKILEIMKCYKK